MRVVPYPWASLERLSRAATRGLAEARRITERAVRHDRLGDAVRSVLACEAYIAVRSVRVDAMPVNGQTIAHNHTDETKVVISVEPELCSAALALLLGRAPGIGTPGAPLDPTLLGALGALIIEVARRTGASEPLALTEPPPAGRACVRIDASVLLDERPYRASAFIEVSQTALAVRAPLALETLGALPVALPLVVGLALGDPNELLALSRGDAWLFGSGVWIDREGCGRGALSAPKSERGVAVDLAPDGSIVVGDETVHLGVDVDFPMSQNDDDAPQALSEAVLDAPVVVRLEIGTVSMTAREWAALRPGDVIETGRRLSAPVVLRVAGREVAHGELVEVEGEIGVRVRQILTGGSQA
jgi:flagellar motor switch/type III secretory pathway protein FliN